MPRFKVTIFREVTQTGGMHVEAATAEAAEEEALRRCRVGDVNWWDDKIASSPAGVLSVEADEQPPAA